MRQEKQKRRNSVRLAAGLVTGLLVFAVSATAPVPVCASADSVSIVVSDPEADQKAADKVSEMLKALPAAGELTGDDEKAVTDVLHAYSQLTDQQKALVKGRERIAALRQEISEAKAREAAAQVESVNQLIQALPEATSITLAHEDAVKTARTAYNSLTDEQKASIANLSRLEAAEAKIADLRSRISTFSLDQKSDDITIIARYKTSTEGTNKVPQFTLKGPGGTEYVLTPATRKMEYADVTVSLYWMDSYVQIDLVNGAFGAWVLEASQPVSYTQTDYTGERYDLEEVTPTPEPTPVPEPSVSARTVWFLYGGTLFAAAAAFFAVFAVRRRKQKLAEKAEREKAERESADVPRKQSREEEIAEIRRSIKEEVRRNRRAAASEKDEKKAPEPEKDEDEDLDKSILNDTSIIEVNDLRTAAAAEDAGIDTSPFFATSGKSWDWDGWDDDEEYEDEDDG